MTPLTVLGIIIGLAMLIKVFDNYYKRDMSLNAFIFWSVIWLGLITISLIPGITTNIANFIGFDRGVDVVIYASIILLFYLHYKTYQKNMALEREITKLVRIMAKKK